MDILHLVDRLEELFNESRTVPFTRNAVVDEDKMLDIIDQMRVTIPNEVKQAQQILSQRDRFLAQAQEEATRIVALAREKADQMVEHDSIVKILDVCRFEPLRKPAPNRRTFVARLAHLCNEERPGQRCNGVCVRVSFAVETSKHERIGD